MRRPSVENFMQRMVKAVVKAGFEGYLVQVSHRDFSLVDASRHLSGVDVNGIYRLIHNRTPIFWIEEGSSVPDGFIDMAKYGHCRKTRVQVYGAPKEKAPKKNAAQSSVSRFDRDPPV